MDSAVKDGNIEYGFDGPGSVRVFAPPARLVSGAIAPQELRAACLLCDVPIPVAGPAFVTHVLDCAKTHPERYAAMVAALDAGEIQ